MKKEIAEKWVTALRSGEYKQTQSFLKDENGFCCLGVLCDIYSKEKNIPWDIKITKFSDGSVSQYYFMDKDDILPKEVQKWAEMEDREGTFVDKEDENSNYIPSLVNLNDDEKYDFNRIADTIEENWSRL